MAKLNAVKVDLSRETDGVWLHYMEGWECRIARQGNDDFRRARRRIAKDDNIRAAASGQMDESDAKKAMAPYVAEFILRDWRGLEDENGAEIPYSVEKATELLLIPELHDWYDWVLEQSRARRHWLADEGNSSASA